MKTLTSLEHGVVTLVFILGFQLVCTTAFGQSGNCTNDTPFFSVDLTGQPGGSFTTPNVAREGNCCGSAVNTNCVEFEVYLDPRASGLAFDITNGPQPGGSMFYQIDCGTPISVGDSTCVDGVGPHVLTICMPGNANNQFTVYSVVAYEEVADISITEGCSGILSAPLAFDPTSVTYNDITGGGTYNSFLSCVSGCAATVVTPDNNAPPFVDYIICGNSNSSNCVSAPFCDTVRVTFFPRIQVSIDPDPALICQNGTTTLQGLVTGGSGGPYTYIWYDAADGTGNIVGSSDSYDATAPGTYSFEVRNENYPDCEPFIANVDVNDNFSIDAGIDQTVCPENSIQLNGVVQGATGGMWTGGSGTFNPDNQALNAIYTPTQNEIDAGSLTLTLTSTGNGNCTPGSDQMTIDFHEAMTVTLDGPPTLCNSNTSSVQAVVSGGSGSYGYLWDTGETTASITKPAGTYGVTVSDLVRGCQTMGSITITQLSGPSSMTASANASTCGNTNGSIMINSVTGGSAPYSYSLDDVTYQSGTVFSNLVAGPYTVFAKDANGCTVNTTLSVNDIAGPTGMQTATNSSLCGNANGSLSVTGVTGGTAPYEYSLDGVNFQSANSFNGLNAGDHNVTLRDANLCEFNKTVTLSDIAGPDAASISATAASCNDNDGTITISSVSNGTSPYQYSLDGTNYQSSNSFSGLASGTYSVYIRDANNCVYIQDQNVLLDAPTAVVANASSATCSLPNGTITVQSVSGGSAPYSYSLDGVQFQSATAFTSVSAGTYTLTARDSDGCTVTTQVQVADTPGPSALQTQSQSSSCGSSNGSLTVTQVTAGTAPYQYSIDGVNFQSATVFNNLAAGAYTVTVRDANNCQFSDIATVNDIGGPTSVDLSSTASTCGNNNGLISVDGVSGGLSPFTYALDGGTYQSISTFLNVLAGTHAVSVQDDNGCIISSSIVVSDIAGPSDFTHSMVASTCGGSDGSITITAVSGGTGPYQYALDNGTYQSANAFSGLAAGVYLVSIKDANDCEISNTLNVTNDGGPNAITYSVIKANCGQNDGSIEIISVSGGDAPYTYSINGINFQSSGIFNALSFGNYEATIQDNKGCFYTEEIRVPSEGPERMELVINHSTCQIDNASIGINSVYGGTAPYVYSLDGTSYQNSPSFSDLAPGDYTVYVQDNQACVITEVVTLLDIPGPQDMQVNIVDATCGLANGEITIASVTGGTEPFRYSLNAGALQTNNNFQGITAGNHSLTIQDANNCQLTISFDINDIPGPTDFTTTTVNSDCGQSNGSLEATAVTGGTAPFTYSIDGTNFQSSPLFSGLAQGQYNLLVRDNNGCEISALVEVQNNDGPQSVTTTIIDETCGNSDGSISITAVNGGLSPYIYAIDDSDFQNSPDFSDLGAALYTIYVKDANDCVYEEQVTVGSNGPNNVTYSSTPASCNVADGTLTIETVTGGSGPYQYSLDGSNFQSSNTFNSLAAGLYSLTVVDANNCSYSLEVTLDGQGPQVSLDELQHISCFSSGDGYIEVSATSSSNPLNYSIDNGVSFQNSGTFLDLQAGIYTIQVVDDNGCTALINDLEIIEPLPLAAEAEILQMPDPGLSNGTAFLEGLNGGVPPYNTTLNGQDMGTDTIFQNLPSAMHTITLEDQNNCIVTFEINMEGEIPELEIPNGFTPNADGRNDTWELQDLNQLYPDAQIQVFNRWGQMVYLSKGYSNPWNGTRQGKELPTATYYYVITLSGDIEPLQGTVTIIR